MTNELSEEPEVIVVIEMSDDTTDREEGPAPKRTKFTWAFKYKTKYYKAQSQSFMPSNPWPLLEKIADV